MAHLVIHFNPIKIIIFSKCSIVNNVARLAALAEHFHLLLGKRILVGVQVQHLVAACPTRQLEAQRVTIFRALCLDLLAEGLGLIKRTWSARQIASHDKSSLTRYNV